MRSTVRLRELLRMYVIVLTYKTKMSEYELGSDKTRAFCYWERESYRL